MSEPITLHVEYDLAEYLEASRALSRRQRRAFLPIRLLFFFLIIFTWFWTIETNGSFGLSRSSSPVQWRFLLVALWPYWVVLGVFLIIVVMWRKSYVKRVYQNRHSVQRPHDFIIDECGMIVVEPLSRHQYQWQAFIRWQETKNLILIYTTTVSAHFIPKRAFASKPQIEALRDLLRTNIDLGNTAYQAFPVEPMPAVPVSSPSSSSR